jgi:hypothetical protein
VHIPNKKKSDEIDEGRGLAERVPYFFSPLGLGYFWGDILNIRGTELMR